MGYKYKVIRDLMSVNSLRLALLVIFDHCACFTTLQHCVSQHGWFFIVYLITQISIITCYFLRCLRLITDNTGGCDILLAASAGAL